MHIIVHSKSEFWQSWLRLHSQGLRMMTSISLSSYEIDLSNQADTLERAAAQPLNPTLQTLDMSKYDRIILTGMGSSDSASIPFEFALLRLGLPAWRIQTSRVVETPELI